MCESIFMPFGREKIQVDIIGQLFKSRFKLVQIGIAGHVALGSIRRVVLHRQYLLVERLPE
jgi:hypothetical protein